MLKKKLWGAVMFKKYGENNGKFKYNKTVILRPCAVKGQMIF